MNTNAKKLVIGGGIAVFLLLNSVFIVEQRQTALVLQFGEYIKQYQAPGLKLKVPFIQNVEFFDNRILNMEAQEKEINAFERNGVITRVEESAPKEEGAITNNDQPSDGRLIRLIVDAYAKYRIVDPLKFYQAVKTEKGLEMRLDSVIESSLKQVLGGVSLTNLLSSGRTDVARNIKTAVNQEVASFGVDVIDVRIKRVELPPKNRDAIYERMRSSKEKEAERLKAEGEEESKRIHAEAEKERTILLADAEKQAQILRGKGDATATKVFVESYGKDADFFAFYRSMMAYTNSLDKESTTVILSPDSEFLRYLGDTKGR